MLLFFLAATAFPTQCSRLYSDLEQSFITRHLVDLFVSGLAASSIGVRTGLSTELHSMACLDLMEQHLRNRKDAETYCSKTNPIKLKYGGSGR